MPHHRVQACEDILDQKLDEYIQTHEEWHKKGYLCPHRGNPKAHKVMDEIMEDVEDAHDMLHIAMKRAGIIPHGHYAAEVANPHPPQASGARTI